MNKKAHLSKNAPKPLQEQPQSSSEYFFQQLQTPQNNTWTTIINLSLQPEKMNRALSCGKTTKATTTPQWKPLGRCVWQLHIIIEFDTKELL